MNFIPDAIDALGLTSVWTYLGLFLVASLVMSTGQLCTSPGLVLGVAGPDFNRFCSAAAEALAGMASGTMLSRGIAASYQSATHRIAEHAGVDTLVRTPHDGCQGGPALFRTTGATFLADPALSEEMFGPDAVRRSARPPSRASCVRCATRTCRKRCCRRCCATTHAEHGGAATANWSGYDRKVTE